MRDIHSCNVRILGIGGISLVFFFFYVKNLKKKCNSVFKLVFIRGFFFIVFYEGLKDFVTLGNLLFCFLAFLPRVG